MAWTDVIATSKLDLNGGSHVFREEDYALSPGTSITEEGQCMVIVDGGTVQPAAGAANERFVGVSKLDSLAISTWSDVELLTVPAVAPFTVTLAEGNLVADRIRVFDVTADANLTEGVVASGVYSVDDTTGVITFHADEAGNDVRVYYTYNLTVEQFQTRFQGRQINRGGASVIDRVTLLRGPGRVRTMQYDETAVFEGAGAEPVVVTSGAGGLFTVGGAGDVVGYVISPPSESDPFLTIELTPA